MTMAPHDPSKSFVRLQAGSVARRSSFDLPARRAALERLGAMVHAHKADIAAAIAADMGKPETEVDLVEILPVLAEISHARRHLRRWMRPRRAWPTLVTLGTSAALYPEPKGVALVIAPWNFPFLLCLAPVISALSAGNAVVVKPSEMTPATAALIARILPATLPDLIAVETGGPEVSQALLALPFDHVFFTGSPSVGKIVMAAAARNLTPVTLELGGKSPVVIGKGANLAQAATWVAWGKVLNAGQICVAPDHVFVHHNDAPAFAKAFAAALQKMAAGGTTAIINDRHYARLMQLIDDAQAKGAQIETLGTDRPEARFMAARLVTNTTAVMEISSEEIFGPLLPLIPYDTLDQPIAAINAGPKPLTLYAFGDSALVTRLQRETASGSLGANLTIMPFVHANLPFGGVGNSGMGAGHGRAGFDTFSHLKPVLINRFTLLPLLFPPYTGRVKRLTAWVKRLVG
jgi:aldehyde dehydrogenase (NAD+)